MATSPPLPRQSPNPVKVGCIICLIIAGVVFGMMIIFAIIGSLISQPGLHSNSSSDARTVAESPSGASAKAPKVWETEFAAGGWDGPRGTLRYFPVRDGIAKMEISVNDKNIVPDYEALALGAYIAQVIYRKINEDSSIRRVELSVLATFDPYTYEDKYGHGHEISATTAQGTIVIDNTDEVRKYTEEAYSRENEYRYRSVLRNFCAPVAEAENQQVLDGLK